MDEIIDMLKSELVLCVKLMTLAENQREALRESIDGRAVIRTTQEIEAVLKELSATEAAKEDFLKRAGAATMADALKKHPYSKEKMRAKNYLARLNELLGKIRRTSFVSQSLLSRDVEYLNFNLNVMTQSATGPGYEGKDASPSTIQGRKLFDKSV
ncbi:MAG: flagellar export chaperone FlgN [Schwartzia sp.]|nr:flagellar export chaperone FlgN [Schwartzia sp. (in: firmicutes)]